MIGDPVRHSLSPLILNAAFAARGLDWVFVAFPVVAGDARRALDGMRALGIEGLSVTMPHKGEVADLVDVLSPDAEALAAVNCVVREGELLRGHNTDGAGFVAGLRAETGFDPAGRACAVVGAGGAARAVVLALAREGAAEVVVVNRTRATAEQAAALAGEAGRVGVAGDISGADLVVNATPVGMAAAAREGQDVLRTPFDPSLLRPEQVVADLVYVPLVTPLVEEARARGATALNGVPMLVHQAAAALTLWTGEPAPVSAMSVAATRTITKA